MKHILLCYITQNVLIVVLVTFITFFELLFLICADSLKLFIAETKRIISMCK